MKKIIKISVKILLGIILTGLILIVIFFYLLNGRVTYVDESSYEHYSIVFEEIGEPFLFGFATGRITLKDHHHIIHREKMDVANDGARIGKGNWNVVWNEDHVLVYIFQDEGYTIEYTIDYDPSKEIQKVLLEPDHIVNTYPSIVDDQEIEEVEEESDLLELEESKEMIQVITFLGYNDYEIKMNAKGYVVLVIDEYQLTQNMDHEYVLTKGDQIIGFYRVENQQVIDEHKTTW